MNENYYSKKISRAMSARNTLDKWAVDNNPEKETPPMPLGYNGNHNIMQNENTPSEISGVSEVKEGNVKKTPHEKNDLQLMSLLENFDVDDILLMALIMVLLLDENSKDNMDLIMVLGFLLITGME